MKRISKLMLFAGALLAVSCSQDELMSIQQDTPIQFRTSVERQTKASSYTVNTLDEFNVTAWNRSDQDPFIDNVTFERSNTDVFKASGSTKYYWPKDADVYFYAYAPKATAANGVTYNNELEIDVEPLANTDNQVDLLYASTIGNKSSNATKGVILNFRHTMSQIQVKVKNSSPDFKFKVTGWKIAGVDGSASFQFDDLSFTDDAATGSRNTFDRSLWADNDDDFSASYSKTFTLKNVTDVNSTWGVLEGSAILIPQTALAATAYSGSDPASNPLNGAYIAVQCQVLDTDDQELTAAGTWACWPVKFDWDPGFRYIYTIDLAELGYSETGKDDLDPLIENMDVPFKFVDVTVDAWQPENDEDANRDVTLAKKSDPFIRFHTEGGVNGLQIYQSSSYSSNTLTHLEYSLDEGSSWTVMEFNDPVEFGENTPGDNHDLLVRGKGFYNYYNSSTGDWEEESYFYFDDDNQLVECSGSVGALYDYENPDADLVYEGQYANLFNYCVCMTTAPEITASNVTENCYSYMFSGCENLICAPQLPAMTLENAKYCYCGMFNYCTNLTTAPELPATSLAEGCYDEMFYGCTSLTVAPALPASTLYENSYYEMFYECTSLNSAPVLSATTMADYCCYEMFYGCTSLTVAPAMSATTMADYCCFSMFYGCTSLTSAPALPATTLAPFCYALMFYECEELTAAPALPATELKAGCYGGMFQDCTKLASVEMLGESYNDMGDISYAFYGYAPTDWLTGVAVNGTISISQNISLNRDELGIPAGWTVNFGN